MAPAIVDDKSPLVIPFILDHLQAHLSSQTAESSVASSTSRPRPFLIGLNGVQGVGKTTLVKSLASTLYERGHPALVLSLDDLYLPHAEQSQLAASQPDNALIQQRGEPGTHDLALAGRFFEDLMAGRPTRVPSYDKAAHGGQGDRAPEETWQAVNQPGAPSVRVVILEGWSVGFRALPESQVEAKWKAQSRTLAKHKLEHLLLVNNKLKGYDVMTNLLDVFVHIDAEDTLFVYDWRKEQEVALRESRGTGMTDEQVVKFVDGYYPAYELYSDALRKGVFPDRPKHQLRMVVGKDRTVKESYII